MKPLSVSISLLGSPHRHHAEVVRTAETFETAGVAVYAGVEAEPDAVYVVSPNGYIGGATMYELGRINERRIPVFFSEEPWDAPFEVPEGSVLDPLDLIHVLRGGFPQLREKPRSRPWVEALIAIDLVIFTIRDHRLHVLLVNRGDEPYKGRTALPGGFVRAGEALEDAASRKLADKTGLDAALLPLQQLKMYSAPERDPRGRVVTTAFLAVAANLPMPVAGADARAADWIEVELTLPDRLAFDHGRILVDALERARTQLEYTAVAAAFCGETFTISELRAVYEIMWGVELDQANFRRKIVKAADFVIPVGRKRRNPRGRPAELYRRGPAKLLYPPMLRTPAQRSGFQTRAAGD